MSLVADDLRRYIGRKIMAYEDVFQFSTGQKVFRRGRNVGIVVAVDEDGVHMYDRKNPKGYQHYTLKKEDFRKWISENLYVAKSASLDERVEALENWKMVQGKTDKVQQKENAVKKIFERE